MGKFDNYIYYSICLKTLGRERPIFHNYRLFCESFKKYLEMESLSVTERRIIQEVGDYLNKVYGLNDKEIGMYIGQYFLEQKYIEFEKLVLLDRSCYPISRKWS